MTHTNLNPTPLVRALGVLLAVASMGSAALAQQAPSTGDVLRQLPSEPPVQRAVPSLPPVGGAAALERPMQSLPSGGPTVQVTGFALVGNREVSEASLQAQLAGEAGKALSLAELEAVASKLTRYYRSLGYFVARVYVPEQEVKDGVVTLRAVEGNYGEFKLDNQSRVQDSTVQGILDAVKAYNIVSVDTLERAMLIINDTPGSRVVRADVMPGEAVGTSDFAVGTVADPAHNGYVLLDNHGTKATGKTRLSGNWDWNSPTGRGDRLTASGLASNQSGLVNGRLGYQAVLSYTGWRGEVALSRTDFETRGDTVAKGQVDGVELSLSYPIRRVQAQTIEFATDVSVRESRVSVPTLDVQARNELQALRLGVRVRDEGVVLGLDGQTQAEAFVTLGDNRIKQSFDDNSDNTDGSYSKLNVLLSRVSVLPHGWALTTAARAQANLGRNLDSAERMGLGGTGGVVAFESGELSGSDAVVLRLDLARALPQHMGLRGQWSVFTNWGQAQATKASSRSELSDVGLSYTARHANGLLIKAQWAYRTNTPLHRQQATGEAGVQGLDRSRFWVQAGWVF